MNSKSADFPSDPDRSTLLMNRYDTAVVVVDVQQKLLPHIMDHTRVLWNIGRIVDGANALGLDVRVTEQYPQGLGATVPEITARLAGGSATAPFDKMMFSCRQCSGLVADLQQRNIKNVLLIGIETHVCVLQSAIDLLTCGFEVFIGVDAVGSRFETDYQTALRRLESSGTTLVTTEMALFEWCVIAGTDEFKQISRIVREPFAG